MRYRAMHAKYTQLLQLDTDAAASAASTVNTILDRSVQNFAAYDRLECEWCCRYSDAQVTFDSQSQTS